MAESAPKTAGRRFAILQAVPQPRMGDSRAKFEEAWKAWEHQADVYEKLATSKPDDDLKISVVLREAPTKLRDNLLVNSQQFETNCNKLRAIIQAYLNTNKNWTADDFRNVTKESDPMELDNLSKGKGKNSGRGKGKSNSKTAASQECHVCGKKKGHTARDCWSRANQDRTVNEVDGAKAESEMAQELVFAIESVVKDVRLSQSGCEVSEDGLVAKWLKIGNNLKGYDIHVVEVTKPMLSASYPREHGIETHLARRKGVCFVKAACVRARVSQNW